jgi:glycosyltransferase involved in cell wall biosynthesis
MRIFFDNVNFQSNSGPNSFGLKLASNFMNKGHTITHQNPDVQVSFIQTNNTLAPTVLRLDGIYFNSEQEWEAMNAPIKHSFEKASGIIYQSNFNKMLTEKYFGEKENSVVIHNGTDLSKIEQIPALSYEVLDRYDTVWCCASSWRPHKRLSENVRYFLEHKTDNSCLVIAGKDPDYKINHPNVYYTGNLDWNSLISLYKRSKYFIHLALMDHCPNVVVDAAASGCHIICASSGGTHEVAGDNATMIKDMDWDYKPFKLYQPPQLDFSLKETLTKSTNLDINVVSDRYLEFFKTTINNM